ncbi:MAG: hypothetical protein Q9197_006264 [Variospora fuerteventurae]
MQEVAPLGNVNIDSPDGTTAYDDNESDKENQAPAAEEPRLSFDTSSEEVLSINGPVVTSAGTKVDVSATSSAAPRNTRSFKHWISHLRPHPLRHKKTLTTSTKRWPIDDSPEPQIETPRRSKDEQRGHRKSSSRSSAGLVDTVKGLAMARSTSTPVSRKSRRSNLFSRSKRGSKQSEDHRRSSLDQSHNSTNTQDDEALKRFIQRQNTLEELADSEASYVADLKVLIHAYFTMLALAPNGPQRTSSQVHNNVTEILQLHEDLLRQINDVVKESEPRIGILQRELPPISRPHRHRSTDGHRITSAVAGLVHVARTSLDTTRSAQLESHPKSSDTSNILAVINIFESMLGRFFIYEEYGAQYQLMLRDMVLTSKSISNWQAFERSIEALANSLAPTSGSEDSAKKGLAFEDLLIKPIQRICKYPLLFDDLYRNTSEIDDAGTRAELSKLTGRLREITIEINKATDDHETQAKLQRSWRLQDLLILPDVVSREATHSLSYPRLQKLQSTSPASLRLLGYPILCGVLYVAWESENEVCGEYMLCVLFRSQLILATLHPSTNRFEVVALVSLSNSQFDKADDGRGLQCHSASFSWKITFEASQQLYELIFCACSAKEENEWTQATIQCIKETSRMQKDETRMTAPIYTALTLHVTPLGPVFGMPGSVTRRLLIQRAATVHSRTNGTQVIIRNTTATKENKDESDSIFGSIGRSKSVLTASRVPILAPKKTERARLESLLSDVWSRDRLPYPGMSSHRGDHPLRASASSMMRKLSRASIGSTFSKRSVSTTSFAESKPGSSVPDLQKIGEGDDERDPRLDAYQSLGSTPCMSRVDEPKLEGSGKLVRTGTVRGVKLSDATNQLQGREVSRVSAQSVRIESTEKGSPRILRKRQSVPAGLLKSFSTDTMKVWRS